MLIFSLILISDVLFGETELKWMTFPERLLYQKAIQMFKTIRGNALNTLERHLLLRLTFIQDVYVHHLASNYIHQSLI